MNDQIGRLHSNAIALHELLLDLACVHLKHTSKGAREVYASQHNITDTGEQSFWWMRDHYDRIAASVNAALVIADTVEILSGVVWDSAVCI